MEKKNPVVKQDGKDMAINMANAYRMQNRAMLELLGITNPEQLAGLTPEQKAAIPFYPPYDELGSSGKVNAAMHMMRTVTDSLTADMIMRIYDRVSHLSDMEMKMNLALGKLDELMQQDMADEAPGEYAAATKADIQAMRNDLTDFINIEVVGRMINPEEMVKFITGVNEFISKHGEFVQAFSTFVAASADESNDADKHNADVLAAIYDMKTTLSTLSDMSRRIINISDQLFDMQHAPKTAPSEPLPVPKVAEVERGMDSYGPAYNITIKGDNNGTLNIGTASGCTTFTDDDDDDVDSDIPDEADEDYHPNCTDCNFDCDDDDDDSALGLWDDERDDDDEPDHPYCPYCAMERQGTQFAAGMGEADELNVLASKNSDAPIPYGILDDIRLYAFEVFNHYFRDQPRPRISIFHLNQLIDAMGTRYCHAASMAYVRSLSGNVVDNYYGIVRNEVFRLIMSEHHPSPDEMEEFILYNLGLAYNELFLETLRNPVVPKPDELNKYIMHRLTYLCNDLEDELPSLCELLKCATFYPKLAKSKGAAEYTIKEYLYNGDLFDKYRNMTRPAAMGDDDGVRIIPNAAGVANRTADDEEEACDCETPSARIEDNLFCNPDFMFNLKQYEDERNLYFAEELIRYGVEKSPLYDRVRENAIREFRIADKNGDELEHVLARIMDAIYGFRGFTNVIRPNIVKTMIDRMAVIVNDAMSEVLLHPDEDSEADNGDDSNEEE